MTTITQGEMLEAIRELLDEAVPGEWSDKEIRRWINLGCRDLTRDTEVLDTLIDIEMTNGDMTVTAPTDMIRCSHVDWLSESDPAANYPLDWRPFNAMDPIWYATQATSSSRPQFFTITGYVPTAQLKIYPKANEDGTLRVKYYRLAHNLEITGEWDNNTALDIPAGWDDAVMSYAEYCALRKDRDPRWQEAKGLYDEIKKGLIGVSRFLSDQPGTVTPAVNNGGLPSWLVNDSPWGGW